MLPLPRSLLWLTPSQRGFGLSTALVAFCFCVVVSSFWFTIYLFLLSIVVLMCVSSFPLDCEPPEGNICFLLILHAKKHQSSVPGTWQMFYKPSLENILGKASLDLSSCHLMTIIANCHLFLYVSGTVENSWFSPYSFIKWINNI